MVATIDRQGAAIDEEVTLLADVPISLMFLDMTYARIPPQAGVKELTAKWNRRPVGVLYLSLRADGRYAILDGGTRWTVCRTLEGDGATLPARVYIDLTVQEEATLWTQYNLSRKNPSLNESWKARIEKGEPEALAIQRACTRSGLSVATDSSGHLGDIKSVGGLQLMYRQRGEQRMGDLLQLLLAVWDRQSGSFAIWVLNGLTAFDAQYAKLVDLGRLRTVLRTYGPDALHTTALQWRGALTQVGFARPWGEALRQAYNKGLRTNRLPDWQDRVRSTRDK